MSVEACHVHVTSVDEWGAVWALRSEDDRQRAAAALALSPWTLYRARCPHRPRGLPSTLPTSHVERSDGR